MKFCAIFAMNLDEFFYVRVAGLKDQVAAKLGPTAPDGIWPAEQLATIRQRVRELQARMSAAFVGDIVPALANAGVRLVDWDSLDAADRLHLVRGLRRAHLPGAHAARRRPRPPFPYISNLSLNLAVIVRDPVTGGARRFARVKVPPLLPRFVALPDGERFVPLEQVIAAHLDQLFPGMEIESTTRSGSPATPTSPSRRRRPTTCWPPSRWSCAASASGGPCASRSGRA